MILGSIWESITSLCMDYNNSVKSNTSPWVFLRFLNCANGNKSRKASHIYLRER